MATAPLTASLTETLSKALNEKFYFGNILTKAQEVAALNPVFWGDTSEAYAKSKFAVALDGSNDYLDCPVFDDYFDGVTDKSWTFNTIMYVNNGDSMILSQKSGNWSIYIFILGNGTGLRCQVRDVSAGGYRRADASGSLSLNTWIFLSVVYDASIGEFKVYINSVDQNVTTTTTGTYVAVEPVSNLTIGQFLSSSYFDGDLDQATFFNKALSSSEITALYNSGNGVHHKDLVGTESYHSSIAAWYDFNTIQNFGRDYHGESHAVSVDGSKKLTLPHQSGGAFDRAFNEPWSIVTWAKPSAVAGGYDRWLNKYDASTGKFIELYNTSGTSFTLIIRETSTTDQIAKAFTTTFDVTNQFVHLALTYDGSTNASGVKMFLNGVEQTNITVTGDTLTATTRLAVDTDFGSASEHTFDELSIYHDELTSTEVTTLYNGGIVAPARTLHTDNLVSDYSFNEQNLELIGRDAHGSNDLTPVSITEADLVGGVKDARTQYADLNGSSDDFSNASIDLDTGGITLSAWINPDTSSTNRIISNSDGTNSQFLLTFDGASRLVFYVMDGNLNSRIGVVSASASPYVDTDMHIVAIYDGTSTDGSGIDVYINGSLQYVSTEDAGVFTARDSMTGFRVGGWSGDTLAGAGYFNGSIYSVGVFNTALSGSDLTALLALNYKSTIADYTGSKTNLVAWYDFENSADLGKDSHGTNHLTVNGSPTVGPARETSLDLFEESIDSTNAVLGHIEGAAAGSDEVTKWTDRSASGFDVVQSTIADAATYIGNGFGTKGSFKDGELDINPEPFNFTGDFAIGCWFKQDELTQFRFPIGVWGSTGSRSFGIRNGSGGAGIQFAVSHDGSNQSNTTITDKPITAGEWYFGFGWHENGVQIGFRMWDIGGNEIGVEQLDPHTTGVFNSTSPFRVGGHTNEWNGEVGDVYVFDKLLTSEEQQKLLDYSRESAGYSV